MAEYIVCPIKSEVAGNARYLRWLQFCESSCPFAHDELVCDNRPSEEHFPTDSRRVDQSRSNEVLAAWGLYNNPIAPPPPPPQTGQSFFKNAFNSFFDARDGQKQQ